MLQKQKQPQSPLSAAGQHPKGCCTVGRSGVECCQCLQGDNQACQEQEGTEPLRPPDHRPQASFKGNVKSESLEACSGTTSMATVPPSH